MPVDPAESTHCLHGQACPTAGWSRPHDGTGLTAADVEAIVARGIAEANQVRAQIRLPFNSTAKMVFAVSDENGNILGLYRMPDATYFSIGVAVAKARNVAYYDNASQLQPIDKINGVAGRHGIHEPDLPLPVPAVLPRRDRHLPARSVLDSHRRRRDQVWNEQGAPLPASAFQSIQGYNDFNPQSNFHDPFNKANQNGVVFFPGSAPLYKDTNGSGSEPARRRPGRQRRRCVPGRRCDLRGVDRLWPTFARSNGPTMVKVRGVRLPYFKYNRNPHVPLNGPKFPAQQFRDLPLPRPRTD